MSPIQEPRPPTENRILAALPQEERDRLAPHLEHVDLPHSKILYDADGPIGHVYFPTGAMISLVSQLPDGSSVEVGVTGFEGMAGLSVIMGIDRSPHMCIVQIPDGAVRVRAEVIKDEFKRGGVLQTLLLGYVHSLMIQVSQVAACNRLHTVEERLARWLLMCYDRCVCEELPLTQEFLAIMLGCRRAGVTTAAITLQADGYIKYTRGHITLTDRRGLQDITCDCYRVLKEDFDRTLSGTKAEPVLVS
jgi:CRP-like cAMP-binding protein